MKLSRGLSIIITFFVLCSVNGLAEVVLGFSQSAEFCLISAFALAWSYDEDL